MLAAQCALLGCRALLKCFSMSKRFGPANPWLRCFLVFLESVKPHRMVTNRNDIERYQSLFSIFDKVGIGNIVLMKHTSVVTETILNRKVFEGLICVALEVYLSSCKISRSSHLGKLQPSQFSDRMVCFELVRNCDCFSALV